jgi:hypothetical protein
MIVEAIFRTFVDVNLDTKRRAVYNPLHRCRACHQATSHIQAVLAAIFRTFVDAQLDTKRQAIFDAASAAVFIPFFGANLDTK